jgi:hypothetical protein
VRPDEVKACVSSLNFAGLASAVLDNIPPDSIFGMDSSSRYKEIYQGWVNYFDNKPDHLAIDVLRAEVMRIRSKDPFRFSLKNVTAHPHSCDAFKDNPSLRLDRPEKVLDAVTAESSLTTGCPSLRTSTT